MKRVKGISGEIHFRNPADPQRCLCGADAASSVEELFGERAALYQETSERVTCRMCARVYAAVKNEPWNALERRALVLGCFDVGADEGHQERIGPNCAAACGAKY